MSNKCGLLHTLGHELLSLVTRTHAQLIPAVALTSLVGPDHFGAWRLDENRIALGTVKILLACYFYFSCLTWQRTSLIFFLF